MSVPPDQAVRDAALDTGRSFIVQAPAGSGKTGLLTQRFLALLARVEQPENVLAITFTRKAAAEMRERVLDALECAASTTGKALPSYERRTHELALAVLAQDRRLGWNLRSAPTRLRVTTIDSLCLGLTQQMPWLSGFGGQVRPVDDAAIYYRRTAREVAGMLDGLPWAEQVQTLLDHMENDLGRFVNLLAEMLNKRDQWLRHLGSGDSDSQARRAALEANLERAIEAELSVLGQPVVQQPRLKSWLEEAFALARYAAVGLSAEGREGSVLSCADAHGLPGWRAEDLARWRALAALCLTQRGAPRSRVTAAEGFGAKRPDLAEYKRRFAALSEAIGRHDELLTLLVGVLQMPRPRYEDAEWKVLDALLTVLPVAAAALQVEFRGGGMVDFIEVVSAACRALGDEQSPTDLALSLDYRIAHLLVDEFQDTSHSHEQLLRRLLAGWERGDGRTLFLVGDPMQSIYRFREADVGVFLRAMRHGLGPVALEPLQLTANFRSRPALIEWTNEVFPEVFVPHDEARAGAVAYRPCRAVRGSAPNTGATLHTLAETGDETIEANYVAGLVEAIYQAQPQASIAILARSRTHLPGIVAALRGRGFAYRELGVERLGDIPLIRDLASIGRALLHPADRIAWLALLRAPFCGLTLQALHRLAAANHAAPVFDLLRNPSLMARLDPESATRAQKVLAVMSAALDMPGACLRDRIERAWESLGGPATDTVGRMPEAEAFLARVEEVEQDGEAMDADVLTRLLDERYDGMPGAWLLQGDAPAQEETGPTPIAVMTIHRAKGLEFDAVIVPGLARQPRQDSRELLAWREHLHPEHGASLLLAPIPGSVRPGRQAEAPSYAYLMRLRRQELNHETTRLLYVACTRAKEQLHLVATVARTASGDLRAPAATTLAARLWRHFPPVGEPALGADSARAKNAKGASGKRSVSADPATLERLPAGWDVPAPLPRLRVPTTTLPESSDADEGLPALQFDWASENARRIGTVVHRTLQALVEQGMDGWLRKSTTQAAGDLRTYRGRHSGAFTSIRMEKWRRSLMAEGVPLDEVAAATARVAATVLGALQDERGRWLLGEGLVDSTGELALTMRLPGGGVRRMVIDRSFVTQDGTRWIVDYKTGSHEGAGREAFLQQERERYAPQLTAYARVVSKLEQRPIKLGLYFPAMQAWVEWDFDDS